MDYAFSMRSLSYSGVCDDRLEKLSSQINYYEENLMQNTIHEVAAFQSQLAGRIIRPHDADYDSARAVWNGMIDKYPALIVRCASATDVIAAVNFCRDNDVPFSVRGGGHNVAGIAVRDGGLVIDLSEMRGVHVDPEARIARVDGGATWADVDQKTQAFGLATPGGVVSDTGVAGLTLGGGFGWLSKKYGLSCDNLLSVDIVTADGRLLKASETEHADLVWGVRAPPAPARRRHPAWPGRRGGPARRRRRSAPRGPAPVPAALSPWPSRTAGRAALRRPAAR
jgi:hypothetical protein